MVKGVLAGLFILVVAVFGYVGYSSYATGRSADRGYASTDEQNGERPRTGARSAASAGTSSLPASQPTGDTNGGSGLVAQGGAAGAGGMVAPATDSIVPNPPNGMTFGGSGHYQLYRQGDLTWRLNTDTGETCVIFATDEEWRKPKVFRAGCRGR